MQLVILAGGRGTRLRERSGTDPKPMVRIGGKPCLEHQLELAKRHGFTDVLLLLGYGAERIVEHFGDGFSWGLNISTVSEKNPLGPAGAVLSAIDRLEERFMVMYGDTMLNVDLTRFWKAHEFSRADVSLALHPNDHPYDSDLVQVDPADRVVAFHPYPHNADLYYPNLVNAALYVVEKAAIATYRSLPTPLDFGKHFFSLMLKEGRFIYGYRTPEYIKDVGTPERLDSIAADLLSGRFEIGSLQTPAPAIFLDRDGTLNYEMDRVAHPDQFQLLPGCAQAIREINHLGCRAIVITNQPVVARGDCTEADLTKIHDKFETLLGREGAYVDRILFCPHHPDKGFHNERPDLKIDCKCRKPSTGLIEEARAVFNIDLTKSWLIGDSTVDIQTARNAGLRSILVLTGHGGRDGRYVVTPDHTAPDLRGAVDFLLAQHREEVHR